MIYLIAGRTGAGKDHLGEKLKKLGLKGITSYTTRPKRHENDDSHIFIEEKDVDSYTDKIASTLINGYTYFACEHQLDEADFYIVDPIGIKDILKNKPDTNFHIVYITADDTKRETVVLDRHDDKNLAKKIFESRSNDEASQFDQFENDIADMTTIDPKVFPENVRAIHKIQNDYENPTFDQWAIFLRDTKLRVQNLTKLVELAIKNDLLEVNDEGFVRVSEKEPLLNKKSYIKPEFFADLLTYHEKEMYEFMMNLLAYSDLTQSQLPTT